MTSEDRLAQLETVIRARRGTDPDASYVARLFEKGRRKIAQKVGEEGVEVAIAATSGTRDDLINESADLIFHLLVLLADDNRTISDVLAELERREGVSGLAEKASRDTR